KYNMHSFEIHGHTDSIGSASYNLNLSKARAAAVMNYLVKNGAPKEKLSIRYFGESTPVASNSTEAGRALNRRVELKVIK
ncbi:MAG TPA: OmpA family protein, partial [Bacteroidales bacterium]|nr:OmpA family protein [Bacteroidales bacterium]